MKFSLLAASLFISLTGFTQSLQLHYDMRHSIDPVLNPTNYPTIYFEYFRNIDTLGTGSTILQFQADLNGNKNNIGQCYTQISQSIKFWKPKIYLNVSYSGGLGVTSSAYGYYIANSFGAGTSFLLFWNGLWIVPVVNIRAVMFDKPSVDPQFTLYFGRGFFHYILLASGSFAFWTENRNHGDESTRDQHGKKFACYGNPQLWVKIKGKLSIGSKISVYYNILQKDRAEFYPTIGMKYQL